MHTLKGDITSVLSIVYVTYHYVIFNDMFFHKEQHKYYKYNWKFSFSVSKYIPLMRLKWTLSMCFSGKEI